MNYSFCLNVRIHYYAKLHFLYTLFSCSNVALVMKAKIVDRIVFNSRRGNYYTLALVGELMWSAYAHSAVMVS